VTASVDAEKRADDGAASSGSTVWKYLFLLVALRLGMKRSSFTATTALTTALVVTSFLCFLAKEAADATTLDEADGLALIEHPPTWLLLRSRTKRKRKKKKKKKKKKSQKREGAPLP